VLDPAKVALELLDATRRSTGRALEAAGLGPHTTPSTVVDVAPGVRLHSYPSATAGPPVLLVPAPIKRSYLWDLEPDVSVVAQAIRRGLRPFLVEWTDRPDDDPAAGLDHHADTLLLACLDAAAARTAAPRVALAGHSLGGTLAAILAARRPDRVAALALLEAPVRFGAAAGSFATLVATTPPSVLALVARGGVPGAFLDQVSALASPREFTLERRLDLLRSIARLGAAADPAAVRTHLRVLRWASDEFRMPGALFRDVVERLYRDDAFARGVLKISGRRIGPHTLTSPLTTVFAPRSAVIPPSSVVPVHEAAAAPDKLLLEYRGDVGVALQHVGVVVGRGAHRDLWPRILDRLGAPAVPG
jgi:polyhydroxyalkanoate synthase subunit PhaC